jgi:hypothetical protein
VILHHGPVANPLPIRVALPQLPVPVLQVSRPGSLRGNRLLNPRGDLRRGLAGNPLLSPPIPPAGPPDNPHGNRQGNLADSLLVVQRDNLLCIHPVNHLRRRQVLLGSRHHSQQVQQVNLLAPQHYSQHGCPNIGHQLRNPPLSPQLIGPLRSLHGCPPQGLQAPPVNQRHSPVRNPLYSRA